MGIDKKTALIEIKNKVEAYIDYLLEVSARYGAPTIDMDFLSETITYVKIMDISDELKNDPEFISELKKELCSSYYVGIIGVDHILKYWLGIEQQKRI